MNTPSNCECPLSDLHRQLTVKIWLPTWQEVSTNTTCWENQSNNHISWGKKNVHENGVNAVNDGKTCFLILTCFVSSSLEMNQEIWHNLCAMDGWIYWWVHGRMAVYLDRNCYRTPLNDKQRESVLQTWIESQMTEKNIQVNKEISIQVLGIKMYTNVVHNYSI